MWWGWGDSEYEIINKKVIASQNSPRLEESGFWEYASEIVVGRHHSIGAE